ncbi:Panacea domain-containing protein [Weissella soli]|uniref:Panacea domain-containing protein n=1 Tax=Weissella soli TaxID=155866 RepID=UPI0011BB8D5D|nr:type II toxin-antitoxin system antitoxin SocA domain-containing protein [Weissella soli]QEA34767.1 DUF4065 domain-containing protein [Weissella soli]
MADLNFDPTAVANYIVEYANGKNKTITNLKLQKILFFVQAAFLTEQDSSLMDVKFSRWQYGPVAKDVYFNFKDRGAQPIIEKAEVLNTNDFTFSVPELGKIKEETKANLNNYIDNLLSYTARDLVQETHDESIWSDYKEEIFMRNAPDYTNDEIREFFKEKVDKKIWEKVLRN